MKLYSWNVNGIRAVLNKGAFQSFIETHQPDILCLQETKAQPDQVELDVPGYHQYWNSAEKRGYSGTLILSKTEPLQTREGFPESIMQKYDASGDAFGDPSKEGRVLAAEYPDFWVATVYTPNSKRELSRLSLRQDHWDPAFLSYMKELESGIHNTDDKNSKSVLFSGDFNVAHQNEDLANPKANIGKHGFTNEERAGFDAMKAAGFVDTFREFYQGNGYYTWWTHWANARERNVGWRIDYWMISQQIQSRLKAAEIHPDVMGSDHCPVSIEISD